MLKNAVIIATSASVYEEDHRKSMETGANAFLPKPIEADRLFDLLRRFLNIEWLYEESPDKTDTNMEKEQKFKKQQGSICLNYWTCWKMKYLPNGKT